MDFLFRSKSKTKSPAEIVTACRQGISKLDNPAQRKVASEEVTRSLQQMKHIYFGDAENEPNPDNTMQLVQQIYHTDLLPALVMNMARIEFEARKDVVSLFNGLLRRQIADRHTTVEYLGAREDTVLALSRNYAATETALQSGQILRECVKHERLARILLKRQQTASQADEIWNYFAYIENSTFDIASDAFSTFKLILTLHKTPAAEFLQENYDRFFLNFTKLLTSNNYVWKRQSLKLLAEILLDRNNYNIMSVYIQDPENLKLMMIMLRDRSAHIQFEAFNVFKVIVANPYKEQAIIDILFRNRDKLIQYLKDFHEDRHENERFVDEKRFCIEQISELKAVG